MVPVTCTMRGRACGASAASSSARLRMVCTSAGAASAPPRLPPPAVAQPCRATSRAVCAGASWLAHSAKRLAPSAVLPSSGMGTKGRRAVDATQPPMCGPSALSRTRAWPLGDTPACQVPGATPSSQARPRLVPPGVRPASPTKRLRCTRKPSGCAAGVLGASTKPPPGRLVDRRRSARLSRVLSSMTRVALPKTKSTSPSTRLARMNTLAGAVGAGRRR